MSLASGSFVYINDGHGQSWTTAVNRRTNGGWNDLGCVTGSEAWIAYSPVGLFSAGEKALSLIQSSPAASISLFT